MRSFLRFGLFDFGKCNYTKMYCFRRFGLFDVGTCNFRHLHAKMRSWRHVRCTASGASACLMLARVIFVICMQRCGPDGMFLRFACFGMFDFGMFDFGMFDFGMFNYCFLLPHPHTHTLPARYWSCSWSRGRAELRLILACLILACLIICFLLPHPHTHFRPGTGLARGHPRQGWTALQQHSAAQTWQMMFLAC